MSHLFNIKSVVLIALIILLFGLMVGQMIHVLLVATRKENRNPRGAVAYEALLLAHLLLACATVCSAYANHGALLFRMKMILAKTGYDSILRLAVHAVSQGLIVPKMDK